MFEISEKNKGRYNKYIFLSFLIYVTGVCCSYAPSCTTGGRTDKRVLRVVSKETAEEWGCVSSVLPDKTGRFWKRATQADIWKI